MLGTIEPESMLAVVEQASRTRCHRQSFVELSLSIIECYGITTAFNFVVDVAYGSSGDNSRFVLCKSIMSGI